MRQGLPIGQCEVEALFMFVAGADSTSMVIRITMLHVLSSPLIYNRLKREIAEAIEEGRASSPIKHSEASALPYLQVRVITVSTNISFLYCAQLKNRVYNTGSHLRRDACSPRSGGANAQGGPCWG